MLGDKRLGGTVPVTGPMPSRALSKERGLAGRLTSPHEMGETPEDFWTKIREVKNQTSTFRRWNYYSAAQPHAFNGMPDIIGVCQGLQQEFSPERIRVVMLVPDQAGGHTSALTTTEVDALRGLDVEVLTIDARRGVQPAEPGNARILADFFDFT